MLLKVLGAANVVRVGVADERVLDVGRIQSKFLEAVDHFILDRIIEDGVDDDDPLRRRQGPRRILGHPDEIQVVEYLRGLGMPLGGRRWSRLTSSAATPAGGRRRRDRRLADSLLQRTELSSSRCL